MTAIDVDPITGEVLRTRLDEVVNNMEWLLFHSGYSPILRESYDGSACLLDVRGRSSPPPGCRCTCYPYDFHVRALLERYGDTMQPDDSYLINDPYLGGAFHLPDVAVITPVFYEGRLIAFTASISHKPDVGGLVARIVRRAAARETLHEGLLSPASASGRRTGSTTTSTRSSAGTAGRRRS